MRPFAKLHRTLVVYRWRCEIRREFCSSIRHYSGVVVNPVVAGGDDGVTARREAAATATVPADEDRRAAGQRYGDRHDAGDDQDDGRRQRRHEDDQTLSRLYARRVAGTLRRGGTSGRRRDVERGHAWRRRRPTEL